MIWPSDHFFLVSLSPQPRNELELSVEESNYKVQNYHTSYFNIKELN